MRRVLAATGAIWAVLAVAFVIAIGHRPAVASQASAPAPAVVVVRLTNGKLIALPVSAQATTQTSASSAGSQAVGLASSGQPATASSNHATTRSS
jgi:hypothetical protein